MLSKIWKRFKKQPWVPEIIAPAERPPSPRQIFGQIFDLVQLSKTFTDSKTFVDAVPRRRPQRIVKDYQKQYGTQLDLARFVRDHFDIPQAPPAPAMTGAERNIAKQVRAYIEEMWSILTREADQRQKKNSSLLPLPHRYIIPGGRFREIYYWDSYFTMLGLREQGHFDLIEDMVKNFAYLIDTYGYIPNGNRTYYLSRSQPPVFGLMVELLADIKGEQVWDTYGLSLLREYRFWMKGRKTSLFSEETVDTAGRVVRLPDGSLLNRYYDDSISPREESFFEDVGLGRTHDESSDFYRHLRAGAESGWDFSSRWFADGETRTSIRTTDIVPIDLNALLCRTEELLAQNYRRQNKFKLAERYDTLAQNRRHALQTYCWDEDTDWFYDYLHTEDRQIKDPHAGALFALYTGIATAEQAARMTDLVEDEFLKPGGIVTTLKHTEEQWDAPNGWAPLQYVAVMGLERYGAHELAETIAMRWCELNIAKYEATGRLYEKYNVEDLEVLAGGGEYVLQDGFGWTNGVLLSLMNKYNMHRANQ